METITTQMEAFFLKIKSLWSALKQSHFLQKKSTQKTIEYTIYLAIVAMIIFIISRLYAILLVSPDDVIYENILSGVSTGEPNPYCWFIRYPLTVILSGLYKLIPSLEWYELFLMGCHVLCYYLIICRTRFLSFNKRIGYIIFSIVIICLLCIEYTVHLEWSTTAGILGATALFRYVTIPAKRKSKNDILEYGICLALLLLGFCIRNTVIYMFIPLAFICWLKRMYEIKMLYKNPKEIRKKQLINFDFAFVATWMVLLVMFIHSIAYSGESWKEYKEYTKERANLVDYYGYPWYDDYQTEYQDAGISGEMYNLIVNDYNYLIAFDQANEIDFSELSTIAKENHNSQSLYEKIVSIYEKIESLFSDERFLIPSFIVVLCILFLLLTLGKEKKINIAYFCGVLLWFFAMILYIAVKGRLPIRVGINIVMGFCAVILGAYYRSYSSSKYVSILKGKYQKICLYMIIICIVSINFFDISLDNKQNEDLAVSKNEIVQYCLQNPQTVYFRDFNSFSQRGNLFCISSHASNYINTGGWNYNTDVFDAILELNGIDGVVNSIKNGKDMCYLVNENRLTREINRLNRYFASINENITVSEVDRFETLSDSVVVLKFIYSD